MKSTLPSAFAKVMLLLALPLILGTVTSEVASAKDASPVPNSVTTMAMEGGCTFVFQLPAGYKLKDRGSPSPGCDCMIWISPDAMGESDGAIFQLAVIKPNSDMQKAVQELKLDDIAASIIQGKASAWSEFHSEPPKDVSISQITFARIDFKGTRKDATSVITGFQLVGQHKDKLLSVVVEVPEKCQLQLDVLKDLLNTIQVQ